MVGDTVEIWELNPGPMQELKCSKPLSHFSSPKSSPPPPPLSSPSRHPGSLSCPMALEYKENLAQHRHITGKRVFFARSNNREYSYAKTERQRLLSLSLPICLSFHLKIKVLFI